MGMKAMCTGIRFWEEMETASTEVSSRLLTQRMRAAAGILAELVDDLAGQQIGDAGAGDGYRERPQHGVGEGDFCTAAQAAGEGAEGLLEGESAEQATHDGTDGEGDHHIDPQQAEHQHQRHRDNNRIHLIFMDCVAASRESQLVCENRLNVEKKSADPGQGTHLLLAVNGNRENGPYSLPRQVPSCRQAAMGSLSGQAGSVQPSSSVSVVSSGLARGQPPRLFQRLTMWQKSSVVRSVS